MQKIQLKPLSINVAYTGKRYKTDAYRAFCRAATLMIRKEALPAPPFEIEIIHGQSNFDAADWDNPIKTFQDVLCKKYGFNDKLIYRGIAEKVPAEKGKEFIIFELRTYKQKTHF